MEGSSGCDMKSLKLRKEDALVCDFVVNGDVWLEVPVLWRIVMIAERGG